MKRFFSLLTAAVILCILFSACAVNTSMPDNTPTDPLQLQESQAAESSEPTAEEYLLDPYVAMLMRSDYDPSSAESDEYVYLVYSSYKDDTGYVIIKQYTGTADTAAIPDMLDGYPVIGFYHNIFEKHSAVSQITFPDTLRTVIFNHNADTLTCMTNTNWYQNQPDGIYYAANIAIGYKGSMPENTTVTFRDGTVGIGGGAFRRQENLVGIDIPPSMVMISEDAFGGCGLKEVTIPRTLQYYVGAFGNCNQLVRVAFEEGIQEIRGTFACDNLSEVILPSTLTTIGEKAFIRCEGLKTITLPDSTRYIDDLAFYQSGLTHIELNDGLTFIGKEAFMGCENLKSVYIPASVTDIGIRTFGYLWDDTLVDGFVAYFEEECSYMQYWTENGIQCEIGTRASANSGS